MAKGKVATITSQDKKSDGLSTTLSSEISNNKNLEVQESAMVIIKDACRRVGVSVDDYVRAIKEGLKADRALMDKFGEVTYEPDHQVRIKSAMLGLEVEGYLKTKGVEGSTNNYFDVKTLVQQWKEMK